MVAGGALIGGCRSDVAFPDRPAMVDVTMREYRFAYDPPRRAGRVVFRAANGGRLDHEMALVLLPPDLPPIERQLRSPNRRLVETIATVPARRPGRTGTFAVELLAGRYALICFLTDADGGQHARKGMSAEFRVR